MALKNVLSAMRALMLDETPPNGDFDQRRAEMARRFPDLSEQEAADLAANEPSRIGVYSHLIFSGERAMLRWAFPMTLAALYRATDAGDDQQDAKAQRDFELSVVRKLHRYRPWENHSTRLLADNFSAWVQAQVAESDAIWTGTIDLAEFERIDLKVFYATDADATACVPANWASLSVETLMKQPVCIPHYVTLARFNYDVPALARHFREHRRFPEKLPEPPGCAAVCSRDLQSHMTRWTALSDRDANMLDVAHGRATVLINDIAEAFLAADTDDATTDEQRFAAFLELIARWAHAGIILSPTRT